MYLTFFCHVSSARKSNLEFVPNIAKQPVMGTLLQILAEITRIERDNLVDILEHLTSKAPHYLSTDEEAHLTKEELLAPPMSHCLNFCRYKVGDRKGQVRQLSWHREPSQVGVTACWSNDICYYKKTCSYLNCEFLSVQVTIFSHTGETFNGLHLTLRCTEQTCGNRYSYGTWTSHSEQCYRLYPVARDYLKVTRKVYVTRKLAQHLQNSV